MSPTDMILHLEITPPAKNKLLKRKRLGIPKKLSYYIYSIEYQDISEKKRVRLEKDCFCCLLKLDIFNRTHMLKRAFVFHQENLTHNR